MLIIPSRCLKLCLTVSLFLCWTTAVRAESSRPDVLMIIVDDMNDWTSLFDEKAPIRVPHLEQLASRGMMFTHAYCASPACNPSRVATLTGLRPSSTGVYGNKSDWRKALPDRPTIMQRFREAGYDVRGAGKVFHHHYDNAFHDEASFDEYSPMAAQSYPPQKLNQAPRYGSRNTDWGAWPPDQKESIDYQTVSACSEMLGKQPEEKPLFLVCGIFKPHSPFFAPAEFINRYAALPFPRRAEDDRNDLPPGAIKLLQSTDWFWTGLQNVEEQHPGAYHRFLQAYAACTSFADAQIGRLLEALDASHRGKQTIILLWSDHGFHLGEKDHLEKFALWEKTTHIPFLVVAPGVTTAESRCDQPVDLTTVYPTLLELCDLPADPECEGISLVPLLKNPNAEWSQPALMTWLQGNHAVRSKNWRFIQYRDGTEELYDCRQDPHEETNLASDPANQQILKELRQYLPEKNMAQVTDMKKPKE